MIEIEIEKIKAKILTDKNIIIDAVLVLYDNAPQNTEMVQIQFENGAEKIVFKNEDYFMTLQDLRNYLESKGIQILCNGSVENVYPSPMQQSMGTGRTAYKTYLGQPAKIDDVVDIFEYEEDLCCVNIEKQKRFHVKWLNSILRK